MGQMYVRLGEPGKCLPNLVILCKRGDRTQASIQEQLKQPLSDPSHVYDLIEMRAESLGFLSTSLINGTVSFIDIWQMRLVFPVWVGEGVMSAVICLRKRDPGIL